MVFVAYVVLKTLNKYIVSFDTNFGSYVAPISIYEGYAITPPEAPTKEDYAFYGWYDNPDFNGEKFDFSTLITSDITLYARWGYSFTCVNYDGSIFYSEALLDGDIIKIVEDPSKENEVFIGWYLDPNFKGEKFVFNTEIHENTTVYASFGFQVNFYSSEASLFKSVVVAEGKKLEAPEVPIKEYHDFADWYKDIDLTNKYNFNEAVNSSFNLFAKFTPSYFDIVYHNCKSATNPNPEKYQYTVGLESLLNATKDGYRFYGWYSDEALTHKVTSIDPNKHEQVDLYAYFSKEYKVTYSNWPEDIENPNPSSFTVEEKEDLILNPFKDYEGFTFESYTDKDGKIHEKTNMNSDMELTVNYEATTTKVTFDANGGEVIGFDNYIYLDSLIPNEEPVKYDAPHCKDESTKGFNPNSHVPHYEGHVFKGWYLDKELTTPINKDSLTVIKCGQTLYAKWIEIPEGYMDIFIGTGYKPGWTPTPYSFEKDDKVYIPYNISRMDIGYYVSCTNGMVNIESSDYNEHTFISHWMYDSGPTHNMVAYTLADYDTSEVTKFDFHVDITYTGSDYECNPQYSYTFSGFKYREEYIKVGPSQTTTINITYWNQTNLPYIGRDGYTFKGWYNGNTLVDITKHFTITESSITLVAHWSKD